MSAISKTLLDATAESVRRRAADFRLDQDLCNGQSSRYPRSYAGDTSIRYACQFRRRKRIRRSPFTIPPDLIPTRTPKSICAEGLDNIRRSWIEERGDSGDAGAA